MDANKIKAMELKYIGKEYKEIAIECATTEGVVKQWFMVDGELYLPYLKYATKQSEKMQELGTTILKSQIEKLIGIMTKTVELYLKAAEKARNENKPDDEIKWHEKATGLAERILDRAGLSTINKSQTLPPDNDAKSLPDEQLRKYFTDRGLDADTGLPNRVPPKATN